MGGPEAQGWQSALPFCFQAVRSLSLSPQIRKGELLARPKAGPPPWLALSLGGQSRGLCRLVQMKSICYGTSWPRGHLAQAGLCLEPWHEALEGGGTWGYWLLGCSETLHPVHMRTPPLSEGRETVPSEPRSATPSQLTRSALLPINSSSCLSGLPCPPFQEPSCLALSGLDLPGSSETPSADCPENCRPWLNGSSIFPCTWPSKGEEDLPVPLCMGCVLAPGHRSKPGAPCPPSNIIDLQTLIMGSRAATSLISVLGPHSADDKFNPTVSCLSLFLLLQPRELAPCRDGSGEGVWTPWSPHAGVTRPVGTGTDGMAGSLELSCETPLPLDAPHPWKTAAPAEAVRHPCLLTPHSPFLPTLASANSAAHTSPNSGSAPDKAVTRALCCRPSRG